MNQIPLYPLRFAPIYQYRPWGGNAWANGFLLRCPATGRSGEAWLLSDRAGWSLRQDEADYERRPGGGCEDPRINRADVRASPDSRVTRSGRGSPPLPIDGGRPIELMERQISQVSFLSAFADYVHQQRPAIGRQWMQLVRESPDVPDAMHITHEALQNHVPELIDDLVDRLRLEKEGSMEAVSAHSRSHGRAQWKAGHNLSELIWEIYIIKRVLKRTVLVEFAREHQEYSAEEGAQAELLISDFFHRLTCDSVGQFTREQRRLAQEKNHALGQTNQARERLTRMPERLAA